MRWNPWLLAAAAAFAAIGAPGLVLWLQGEFDIFWTTPGAALCQCYGSCLVCLWGAWLHRSPRVGRR